MCFTFSVQCALGKATGFSASGLGLPLSLAAGANASLTATFSPTATGNASGTIGIVSNATGSPTNVSLSGSGVTSRSVSLSWTQSNSPNISGYNVYRGGMSGGPYTLLNSALVIGTTYTDNPVVAGQTYYDYSREPQQSGERKFE